jgi:hypothetical protein
MGKYVNLISKMRKREKIAEVQVRLIMKELEKNEVINNPRSSELERKEVFIKTVLKHTNLKERFVRRIVEGGNRIG